MEDQLEAQIAAELSAALAARPPAPGLVIESLTVRIERGPAIQRAILVRVSPDIQGAINQPNF